MSDFDASQFLDTVFTAPSETEVIPCPVGEYAATIDKVDARGWASKDDPTKKGVAMDILWVVDDESVKQACKRDKVIVKQTVMFSFTPDGLIDMDKAQADVRFGKLRDAVGLNGNQFSPSMLPGKMARISVKHRAGDDQIFAEVKSVTRY